MTDKNENSSIFARDLALYTTHSERSADLIDEIENILNRKLNEQESLAIRLGIEGFISSAVIYIISCLAIDENKKSAFLTLYGENTQKIFQIFRGWSLKEITVYNNNVVFGIGELYYKCLKGKIVLSIKDLKNLWNTFADMIIMDLNYGPEITEGNKQKDILLHKVIELKLAQLSYDIRRKIADNIELLK